MANVPPKQPVSGADSVQINTSEGLPHFSDGYSTPPPFDQQGQSFVALRNQATAGDAYNILKAFQDYMELERQRAQKRTMILAATFAIILVVVLVGFFFIWFSSMRSMQGTQNALMSAALNSAKTHEIINTPPPKIQDNTHPIDIEAAITAAIKKSKEIETAASVDKELSAVQKAQEEQAKALALMVEKMTETLNEVKKDNEELRAQVRKAASEKLAVPPTPKVTSQSQVKKVPQGLTTSPATKPKTQSVATTKPPLAVKQPPTPTVAPTKPTTPPKKEVAKPKTGVFTETPEITIKRKEPPKGFEASDVQLPIGKDGKENVNWRIYFPSEAR